MLHVFLSQWWKVATFLVPYSAASIPKTESRFIRSVVQYGGVTKPFIQGSNAHYVVFIILRPKHIPVDTKTNKKTEIVRKQVYIYIKPHVNGLYNTYAPTTTDCLWNRLADGCTLWNYSAPIVLVSTRSQICGHLV